MDNPLASLFSRPATSTFLGGMRSGAFSSSLMVGIFSLVSLTGLVAALPVAAACGIVLTTSLFNGVMAVKRSGEHKPVAAPVMARNPRSVSAPAAGHAIQQEMEIASEAPAQADTKWIERTGRSGQASQTRIQQILDNGSLSDKDRASQILTARENAAKGQAL